MNDYILSFQRFLKDQGQRSVNTSSSYTIDLNKFENYLRNKNQNLIEASKTSILTYMMFMQNYGMSDSTIARTLSSLRSFYQYMLHEGIIKKDPTYNIKSPKLEDRELEYLTDEDLENLLSQFDKTDAVELKEYTIFNLIIKLGVKATELTQLKIEDLNIQMGFIKIETEYDLRYIKLEKEIIDLLEIYLLSLEVSIESSRALFYSKRKAPYTRQGIWKMIKKYSEILGKDINPRILRNTCVIHFIKKGITPLEIKKIMGYSDLAVLEPFYKTLEK